jgi:hypothetical protein
MQVVGFDTGSHILGKPRWLVLFYFQGRSNVFDIIGGGGYIPSRTGLSQMLLTVVHLNPQVSRAELA